MTGVQDRICPCFYLRALRAGPAVFYTLSISHALQGFPLGEADARSAADEGTGHTDRLAGGPSSVWPPASHLPPRGKAFGCSAHRSNGQSLHPLLFEPEGHQQAPRQRVAAAQPLTASASAPAARSGAERAGVKIRQFPFAPTSLPRTIGCGEAVLRGTASGAGSAGPPNRSRPIRTTPVSA